MTNENNEIIDKLQIIEDTLKTSTNLLFSAPIIFLPIVLGTVITSIMNYLLPYAIDPFSWWGIGNLSFYSFGEIIYSFFHFFLTVTIYNLTALATIALAKGLVLKQSVTVRDSFDYIIANPVNFALIALIGQLLLFTYLLIPLGIMVFIVAIVENSNYLITIKVSLDFVKKYPIEMIAYSLLWLFSRYILVQIQFILILKVISDLVIGISVLSLYLEHRNISKLG